MQANTGSKATQNTGIQNSNITFDLPEGENENKNTPKLLTKEEFEQRQKNSLEFTNKLEERVEKVEKMPQTGNPDAKILDAMMTQVEPRYDIVQNRSTLFLIIPDLKNSDEDRGLVLNPGEIVKLTYFYSPQQINRSRGLIYAATEIKGIDGPALVPLKTVEDGNSFVVPKKEHKEAGTTFKDKADNDFDHRFQELNAREEKREAKLLMKNMGLRVSSKHGSVSHV